MHTPDALIEFSDVDLSFSGVKIMENLSMTVHTGDKVILTGRSGCGKSSLLSLVLGFVEPDSGTILFDGAEVNGKNVWNIRKKVSFVDQDVSLGSGPVANLFEFASRLKANAHLDFRPHELMRFFDLHGILHKDLKELSGGERQRLAVVVSVLLGRSVFFLDEVTSSLDGNLKKKVAAYFLEKRDWTCLVVSHDPVWLENDSVRVFDFEEKVWRHRTSP